MKTRTSLTSAFLAAACLGTCLSVRPAAAGVDAKGFVCGSADGVPATNVVTAGGKQVPVIRWSSNVFNDAGWTPQRRCQEVSSRFDGFFKQGRLTHITTGRMNGLPVICTARSNGGACDGLLYTLRSRV